MTPITIYPSRRCPELMGTREAAECLGTTTQNLNKWRGLPDPVAELACGRIWLADEIRAHAAQRREGR